MFCGIHFGLTGGHDGAGDLDLGRGGEEVGGHAGDAFCADGGALDDEVAVAEFHAVEGLDGGFGDAGVDVFEEGEALSSGLVWRRDDDEEEEEVPWKDRCRCLGQG